MGSTDECIRELVEKKKREGEKAFEEFKRENNIPEFKKITDRECQRRIKVGACFKPYYGLTFMSMLPQDAQKHLCEKVQSLKAKLADIGLIDRFLFVPPDTYHITFKGVIERILPKVTHEEIDFYKKEQALSSCNPTDFPAEFKISGFSRFRDLVLIAEASPVKSSVSIRIGEEVIEKDRFHVTLAYFVVALSDSEDEQLKNCLKEASESLLGGALTFQVDDVQMYRFESMSKYEPVPGTGLFTR